MSPARTLCCGLAVIVVATLTAAGLFLYGYSIWLGFHADILGWLEAWLAGFGAFNLAQRAIEPTERLFPELA